MFKSIKYYTLCFVILSSIILSACAGGAQLYPANEKAKKIGALALQYQADPFNGLIGTVSGTMPNGEILNGQYTSVDNSVQSFGSIYASVYGSGTSTATAMGSGGFATAMGDSNYFGSGSGSFSSLFAPSSRFGTVNMMGNKGTIIECEYIYNSSGGGIGACKTDNGALYKMQIR